MPSRRAPRRVRETVSLYDAKTHLSSLVDRAAAGEEILIAKSGRQYTPLVILQTMAERGLTYHEAMAVIEAKAAMLDKPVDEVAALYRGQSSLGRLATADDIAGMAVFLASGLACTVNGQAMAVDGNTEKLY